MRLWDWRGCRACEIGARVLQMQGSNWQAGGELQLAQLQGGWARRDVQTRKRMRSGMTGTPEPVAVFDWCNTHRWKMRQVSEHLRRFQVSFLSSSRSRWIICFEVWAGADGHG